MSDGSAGDDGQNPEEPFGPVEPAEYDPENQFGSPERDLAPQAPTPSTAPEDVDRDLAATWWTSVVLANVALGAPAVGLMLIYFRGEWRAGGAAVLVGLLAAAALVRSIRGFHQRRDEDDDVGDGRAGAERARDGDDNA
ncbi:MAG: hypothetical protein V5A31_12705 [Haloferacaceae archaeon]